MDRFLRIHQVCEQVGLGETSVRKLIKAGQFPDSLKPFQGLVTAEDAARWSENEVQAFIAARKLRRAS